jgi:hypothetical protein
MEENSDNNLTTPPDEFVSKTLQSTWHLLRLIWRRVENIVFFLVLMLVGLYFLLQSSAVQNWLIQKTTTYLSEELQTTVKIGHIDIAFFDNLVLDNFFVADQKGDTLLYAGKLKAGLNSNIFQIINSKLEFDEIGPIYTSNAKQATTTTICNLFLIGCQKQKKVALTSKNLPLLSKSKTSILTIFV